MGKKKVAFNVDLQNAKWGAALCKVSGFPVAAISCSVRAVLQHSREVASNFSPVGAAKPSATYCSLLCSARMGNGKLHLQQRHTCTTRCVHQPLLKKLKLHHRSTTELQNTAALQQSSP